MEFLALATILDKAKKKVTEKEPPNVISLNITEARSMRDTPDEVLKGSDASGGGSEG